ncbi:MAG: hypothetical protein JNM36_16115 [Chitinophagales bacterium]|nr:hypothetical protein [Chitinophagales bacterium]
MENLNKNVVVVKTTDTELQPQVLELQMLAQNVQNALYGFYAAVNQPQPELKLATGAITPWGVIGNSIANVGACTTAIVQINAQTERARIAKDVLIHLIDAFQKKATEMILADKHKFDETIAEAKQKSYDKRSTINALIELLSKIILIPEYKKFNQLLKTIIILERETTDITNNLINSYYSKSTHKILK